MKSERASRGVSQAQLSGTVKGTELTIDGEEWKSSCGGVGGKQCVYFELSDYRRDSVEISCRKDIGAGHRKYITNCRTGLQDSGRVVER